MERDVCTAETMLNLHYSYTHLWWGWVSKEALKGLVNRNIIITTRFSGVTGQLIKVKDDYAVLQEAGDSLVYIPIKSIELVTLVEEEEI
ncbi:DUF2642 domain-containing protein [Peribacillus frigoritolerans]|uniref:DUF2642 domain-containing protein n=1 Tax=Peribacillus frigoritolerans TaxID=450367 RepID=UPI0021CF177F|nr:DUF2642 domain-containing protein [Peribacillus frigoritolerans]MCU6603156.1 DUF2642 domain-containing protein [Peribacillus frigoritolerans]